MGITSFTLDGDESCPANLQSTVREVYHEGRSAVKGRDRSTVAPRTISDPRRG